MFGSFRDLAFLGVAAGTGVALDPDAQAYITAVETVDGQSLEAGVRTAINDFVVGCKADGIWTAIKASCIMAGARTRLGAMVPLVGAAPTSFNFVDGDYNRKTGLAGNGSTKYLNAEIRDNESGMSLNNIHLAAYKTQTGLTTGVRYLIGASDSEIYTNGGNLVAQCRSSPFAMGLASDNNFIGISRGSSAGFDRRVNSVTTFSIATSTTVANIKIGVFARVLPSLYSSHRLSFYSIGESLDLALLDARVTDLINAFGAAIP
jgi:hypothetical protein